MIKEMLGEILPSFDVEAVAACTCNCSCTTRAGSGSGATSGFDAGAKIPE